MKLTMDFTGGKELAANLAQLSKRISKGIVSDALVYGAEPIRKRASAIAPRRAPQPDMADNIIVAKLRARQDETAAVAVGPSSDFYHGVFQELGTVHHGAQAFMRPAFDTEHTLALKRIGQEMWRALAARGFSQTTTSSAPIQGGEGGGLL